MIIECVNCNKKFEVDSELIPLKGRTIQCGSCNHVWFFDKSKVDFKSQKKEFVYKKEEVSFEKLSSNNTPIKEKNKSSIKKSSALVEYKKKRKFTFLQFFNYILVFLISFIALILILDTFKNQISNIFPNLELILFNLFEILKDILLFTKDLI